jgi:hypothetical protein
VTKYLHISDSLLLFMVQTLQVNDSWITKATKKWLVKWQKISSWSGWHRVSIDLCVIFLF